MNTDVRHDPTAESPVSTSMALGKDEKSLLPTNFDEPEVIRALGRLADTINRPDIPSLSFRKFIVILDTNVAIQALLHEARTGYKASLQFSLISGRVLTLAPLGMEREVLEKIEEIHHRGQADQEKMLGIWNTSYRPHIRFVSIPPRMRTETKLQRDLRDPTDVEYIQAHELLGTEAVLSDDKDIQALGITPDTSRPTRHLLLDLRDYSKNRAFEISILMGSTVAVVGSFKLIGGIIGLAGAGVNLLRRLPPWVQVILACGTIVALLHPKSREALKNATDRISENIDEIVTELGPCILRLLDCLDAARIEAARLEAKLPKHMSPPEGKNLKENIARILARTPEPQYAQQISDRLLKDGIYRPNPRTFVYRVRYELRKHPCFKAEGYTDRWGLA